MAASAERTVLVTGATGFVGRSLVDELVDRGFRVTCLVRRPEQADGFARRGLSAVVADVARRESLAALERGPGFDWVIHAAGVLAARRSLEFEAVNREGCRNLYAVLLAGPRLPERVVHVSSIAAAGPAAGAWPRREEEPEAPVSLYGRTKLAGEAVARSAMDRLAVTIVRPCVVYGPEDRNALPIYRMVASGVVVRPPGQPKCLSLVHVRDLARLVVRLAETPTAAGELYNVATGPPCAWDHLVELVAAALGRRPRQVALGRLPFWTLAQVHALQGLLRPGVRPDLLTPQKLPEVYARYWHADTSKLRRAVGELEAIDLAAGVQETAAWYRNAGWL